MKKRFLILLMVFALLTTCAACGGSPASSAAPVSEVETTAEAETAPEVPSLTEPAEPPSSEAEPVESSSVEEAAPVHNDTIIEYPLSDGETLSIFCACPGGPPIVRDSWADVELFQEAEKFLGVNIEWNEVDMMSLDTQFNLMIASGDYSDMISGVVNSYTTGATGAYEDGVIIDIADLVYDNMPNYWNYVHADPVTEKYVMSEEGYELAVYVVNDQSLTEKGLLIRQDWLDALGLAVPETFDELEDTLLAFKDAYNSSETMYVGETGLGVTALTCGYDIVYYNNDLALYVDDDGHLVCSYLTDNYRDYLEMMNRWIGAGIVDGDMILNAGSVSMNDSQTYICTDQAGVFQSSANTLSTYYSSSVNPDFDLTPINVIVRNKGGDTTNRFATFEPVQTRQTVSISTDCSNVELALKWLDYWYTDDGIEQMTYGVEGLSYEKDADGNISLTEAVTNDPSYSPATMIMKYNCQGKITGVMLQKAFWSSYLEKQQEVMDFWSTQISYDREIPTYVTLTTQEMNEYTTLITDALVVAESELTKFLFGERDFSEWDDFVAGLKDMGVEDAIAIYQAAYDRQTA